MKYLFSLLAICILFAFAFIPAVPGYQIRGTVTGLPDSTWLFPRTATPDKNIDSCRVLGGRFRMSGWIAEKVVPVYLSTAKIHQLCVFLAGKHGNQPDAESRRVQKDRAFDHFSCNIFLSFVSFSYETYAFLFCLFIMPPCCCCPAKTAFTDRFPTAK